MDWIFNPEIWIALLTLTALEIVLGIDNIIFITVLAGRLPADQRSSSRIIGLAMAFSVGVEMLNIRIRARRSKPVKLHNTLPTE